MILFLFSVLSGAMLCLFLCSPFQFYPILVLLFLCSIAILFFARKLVTYQRKAFYLLLPFPFLAAFLAVSFLVFTSFEQPFRPPSSSSIDKDKRAIVFYYSNEPEVYSIRFAGKLLKEDVPIIKPFSAMLMKLQLRQYRLSKQYSAQDGDRYIDQIAQQTSQSLMNHYPYLFYRACTNTTPSLQNAIACAAKDGCSQITILRYTPYATGLSAEFIKAYADHGIRISETKPILLAPSFPTAIVQRISKFETFSSTTGIVLDTSSTDSDGSVDKASLEIASLLQERGFPKDNLRLCSSSEVEMAIVSLHQKGLNNICVVKLMNDNDNFKNTLEMVFLQKKYSDSLQLEVISSWGNSQRLVRACIETIKGGL